MRIRKANAALLGVASFLAFVTAADADGRRSIKDDPYAAPYIWTGAYVGAFLGAAWTNADTHNTANPGVQVGLFKGGLADGGLPSSVSQDSAAFTGGVVVGYNFQNGSIVYGIEADISALGHDESSSVTTHTGFNPILTTTTETRVDWLGTLRARIGMLTTPNTLAYLTGGLAFGNVDASTTIVIPAGGCVANAYCSVGSASEVRFGWTIGGGLEHAFSRGWSLKAEYLYFNLGDVTYTGHSTAGFVSGLPTLDSRVSVDGHIARVGLNYKF